MHGTTLYRAFRNVVREGVGADRCILLRPDIECRPGIGSIRSAVDLCIQPMDTGGNPDVFEQRAQGHLAGMPLEIVDTVLARVTAVNDKMSIADDFKPPWLNFYS